LAILSVLQSIRPVVGANAVPKRRFILVDRDPWVIGSAIVDASVAFLEPGAMPSGGGTQGEATQANAVAALPCLLAARARLDGASSLTALRRVPSCAFGHIQIPPEHVDS
jgi:hypothetical protein